MSELLNRAANVRAPNNVDTGTATSAGVSKYLADTTSRWGAAIRGPVGKPYGRWYELTNLGANAVYYYFSKTSGGSVTIGVTPTTDGIPAADSGLPIGKYLGPGDTVQRKLPPLGTGESWYLVRKTAATSTTLELCLSEGA